MQAASVLVTEFLRLDERLEALIADPARAEDLHVFDFDGVLSAPDEEAIYRHPVSKKEEQLIPKVRDALGLDCRGLDLRYQRHLLFQEIQWRRGAPIAPGPALELAAKLSRDSRLFILTARSGVAAVRRMHDFLDRRGLHPIETFHVGRVRKSLQIMLLRREAPQATIWYYEDNEKHLSAVQAAHADAPDGSGRLELVLLKSDATEDREEIVEKAIFDAYDAALRDGEPGDGRDGRREDAREDAQRAGQERRQGRRFADV